MLGRQAVVQAKFDGVPCRQCGSTFVKFILAQQGDYDNGDNLGERYSASCSVCGLELEYENSKGDDAGLQKARDEYPDGDWKVN